MGCCPESGDSYGIVDSGNGEMSGAVISGISPVERNGDALSTARLRRTVDNAPRPCLLRNAPSNRWVTKKLRCKIKTDPKAKVLVMVPIWDYSMSMRVISKKLLLTFCEKHPAAKQALLAWHGEAMKAAWMTPQDIKARYATASFVGNNRVVFNIKGNDYRLVVAIAYRVGVVYIKFVGTHGEYDKIDVNTVEPE